MPSKHSFQTLHTINTAFVDVNYFSLFFQSFTKKKKKKGIFIKEVTCFPLNVTSIFFGDSLHLAEELCNLS